MSDGNENFFVLTGIDGSGKTTLLRAARARRSAWEIGSLHPEDWLPHPELPHFDWAITRHPKTILHGLAPGARATLLLDLLFTHWEYWLRPRLEAGCTVLLDSYYYRFYAKETVRGWVPPWFYRALDSLPDAGTIIVVDLAPEDAASRLQQFEVYEVDRHRTLEDFIRFQTRVRAVLEDVCQRAGRIVTIDARAPLEDVVEVLLSVVDGGVSSIDRRPASSWVR